MALIVGGTTVTGTQTLEASTLTGTASAINGSNITNLPAPSAANVGTATAGLGAGDVGTYAFGNSTTGAGNAVQVNFDGNAAGSSIKASNATGVNPGAGVGSGTWKCLGAGGSNLTKTEYTTVVWLRTS